MERLPVSALRWVCDPTQFEFDTTTQVGELTGVFGQDRAVASIRFGISIHREGYNIFAMGPQGTGKQTVVERCLGEHAAREANPSDWCYVNNFDDLRRPLAIALPPGYGVRFRDDINELIEDLTNAIPAALESEEHRARLAEIEHDEEAQQNKEFQALSDKAETLHVQMFRTPGGFVLAPAPEGKVLEPPEFDKLPRDEQKRMSGIADEMRRRLSREAERQHLRWGFRQRSGSISQIATETDAEIVVPGWGESQWANSMRSGVATHRTPDRLIMAVVDESSAASPQVVEAARSLLGPNGLKRLIILSLQRVDNNASEQLRKSCDQSSGEVGIAVASVEKLIQHLRLLRPTFVLLGRDQPLSADVRLHKTLTSIKCPMALIRTTPGLSSRTDRLA